MDVAVAGRVFIVGANASGKSNLLDVLRFLHDLVAVGGGFQSAVERRGGVSRIRSLSARRYPEIELKIDVGRADAVEWQYELAFTQDNRQRPIITREVVVDKAAKRLVDRPNAGDREDPARRVQTYLEQVQANRDFRPLADFLSTISYQHVVPQLIRESDRWRASSEDPFGSDLLERVAGIPERTQRSRLGRISRALQVAVPQLSELRLHRDSRGTPHLVGRYEHWRPNAGWQREDQFSDGTLRLFGLLWAALEGTGPLLLEEPELSLHPGVVSVIPQMFSRMHRQSGRQLWVSTHAPELLTDEGIGLDEVLLLRPSAEGTEVTVASAESDAAALLSNGLTLAEVVIPRTQPARTEQLAMFAV